MDFTQSDLLSRGTLHPPGGASDGCPKGQVVGLITFNQSLLSLHKTDKWKGRYMLRFDDCHDISNIP